MPAQAWVTMIVGGLAAAGVIITWQQKNHADKRSEWWRRTQWAFECAFNSNSQGGRAKAELGWTLLNTLVESKLASRDDSDIVQVIAQQALTASRDWEDGNGGERNE